MERGPPIHVILVSFVLALREKLYMYFLNRVRVSLVSYGTSIDGNIVRDLF